MSTGSSVGSNGGGSGTGQSVQLPQSSGGGVEWSRTLLVDGVKGDDANTGYTQPVKTLDRAMNAAGNGHTVLIAEGEYAPQALELIKLNLTVAGMTPGGSGGVKTTVGAIDAIQVGPKLSQLKASGMTLRHPAGNGAHTADMLITGATLVDSPSFWEDHGSKLSGNVVLQGSGAKYLYGTQFEGSVVAMTGSGLVAMSDCSGNGSGVLSIRSGVAYALRNVSGFGLDIQAGAINVIDALKAMGATEAQAWGVAQSTFTAIDAKALNLSGRLTVSDTAVADMTTNTQISAAVWERSAALAFAQTTSGRTITLADAIDGTTTHVRIFRNDGMASMTLEGYALDAGAAVIGILPAGETDWVFVGGGAAAEAPAAQELSGVINWLGAQLLAKQLVYIIPNAVQGGPWYAKPLTMLTEADAAQSPAVGYVDSATSVAGGARFAMKRLNQAAILPGIGGSFTSGQPVWYRPFETERWGSDHGTKGNAVRLGYASNDAGDNAAFSIRFDPQWAASVVYDAPPAGPVVSGAVLSRAVTDSAAVATVGRYIIQEGVTLAGDFVGHAGEYVDWAGGYDDTDPQALVPNGFVFVVPDDGDTVLVNDTGEVWRYTAADATKWAKQSQTTGLPVYPWDIDSAYSAGVLVIKDKQLWQANDNIPEDTAFVEGLTGETWTNISASSAGEPSWSDAGTIQGAGLRTTAGGAVAPASFPVRNRVYYKKLGAKTRKQLLTYATTASTSGAIAGSGSYVFKLADGQAFDTTLQHQSIYTGNVGVSAWWNISRALPGSRGGYTGFGEGGDVYIVPYSATEYRILIAIIGVYVGFWGGVAAPFTTGEMWLNVEFTYQAA